MMAILSRGAATLMRDRTGLLLSALATAIVTLPVWFVRFAPLHDFPFHVARMFILNDLVHGGAFTRFYEVNSLVIPNLGMDLVVLALEQVFSIETACRIFIVLMIFLMISGADFLHRTLFRTSGLAVPIAALLAYNSIFVLGFMNYLLGVALVPWAAGIFIRVRSWPALPRLALGLVLGLVLFLAHLVAFGLYAIIVAGLELQAVWPILRTAPRAAAARLAWSAMPFVVIVALFFLFSPTAGAPTDRPPGSQFDGSLAWIVGTLKYKLWLLRRFLVGGQNLLLDYATAGLAIVIAAVLFMVTRVRIARQAMLALGLLCLAFLLAPSFLLSATYLDMRLPIAIALVAAGCVHFAAGTARMQMRLMVLLFGLVVLRSAVLTRDWIGYDAVQRQFTDAFACLPSDSVLFVARPPGTGMGLWSGYWQPPIKQIASLASVTHGIFVPQTAANPAQQSIRLRPYVEEMYAFQNKPGPLPVANVAALHATIGAIRALMQRSGAAPTRGGAWVVYLMLLETRGLDDPVVEEAPRVFHNGLFSIYRLIPDAQGGGADACAMSATAEGTSYVR